ncbi:MAG: bifunctional adenosylcobinamide kinase/adenosylcobinamide-phosphate guanylyltransferase [Candidatus Omnitrophota bacterium]|nr:bifunctional adenosylcobinamide kinase/adenosylcobinamide-phosphate guanylyltransferase [Candidatus Omnitrophota bacterium]
MKRLILILGGARSGKSSYAMNLAKSTGKRIVFIATCIPGDSEMKHRIKLHKKSRPRTWRVIEEGIHIDSALREVKAGYDAVLIDCVGLFISNLMAVESSDKKIEEKVRSVIDAIKKSACEVIVVSNEVGMGIVPDNPLARRFRDLLGRVNQMIAQSADKVIMMYAGIPMVMKGEHDATATRYNTKD